LKIGMVSEFYYPQPGGVSEHIRSLSNELEILGHQVVVITSNLRGNVCEPGPRVVRLGRSLPVRYNGSLSRITVGRGLRRGLSRILEEEDPDLLHIHNPLMPTLPLLALHQARCPVVATFHSQFPRDLLLTLLRRPLEELFWKLQARMAVSLSAQRSVGRLFPGDYRVVPNGVDFDFISTAAAQARRERVTAPRKRLRVLFVGAMVPRKGLPCLLRAFERLAARRGDVELVVVGDGPALPAMRRLVPGEARALVRFAGSVSRTRLARYYATSDIFCAPGLGRESFGMVLLEAMAAGLPVVASDIEGFRNVLTHGQEGLLVPPNQPEVLARTLEELLDNPDDREEFGRRGRLTAARYRWSEIARQVAGLYLDCLDAPGKWTLSGEPRESGALDLLGAERPSPARPRHMIGRR
jgi:phosphatidyl-myo-inositol alpha-mannosyltransferase